MGIAQATSPVAKMRFAQVKNNVDIKKVQIYQSKTYFGRKFETLFKNCIPLFYFLKNATKVSFLCMILKNVSRMDIHVYIQMDPHVAQAGSKRLALVCHVMKLD